MKLTRRQLLLAGLATGVAATGTYEHLRLQKERQLRSELEALAEAKLSQQDARQKLVEWFGGDEKRLQQALSVTQEPGRLTAPKIPYDRGISKILIQCCRISTEQYILGKLDPKYDGAIKDLPTYSKQLDRYTQIAVIRGLEDDQITQDVEVEVPINPATGKPDPVEKNLQDAKNQIGQTIKQVVPLSQKIPVYFGFVLRSQQQQIIVFRGTNRTSEWIKNILVFQTDYDERGYGRVHSGFANLYETLAYRASNQQAGDIGKILNSTLPIYVAGHSLGGALAALAAIDIALKFPLFKDQLRLYTYASPRVGDPNFATKHSQLIPNSYRVVNLADLFPLLPPINPPDTRFFKGQVFSHVGQEWSFLANLVDMDLNHRVDTYRSAILRGLETNKARTYPVSGLT